MENSLFQGKSVKLTVEEPGIVPKAVSRWVRDSEYIRLLDNEPTFLPSEKKIREWMEKDLESGRPQSYSFSIRTLEGDQLIGFVGLGGIQWTHGDCWVGIGLGERQFWGQGYGTEAMQLALRFAFTELNLHRVTLGVFEYNSRAIRSYEKAGFVLEGRERGISFREGRRSDALIMGVLREDWLKASQPATLQLVE